MYFMDTGQFQQLVQIIRGLNAMVRADNSNTM